MILIADSGSTKTDWCLLEQGVRLLQLTTPGINPVFQTEEEIFSNLQTHLLPQLPAETVLHAIHFYGAGCIPEKVAVVQAALMRALVCTGDCPVEVCSDMVGAARALCGRTDGIVCILGTGSNSCVYKEGSIVANVSPLGFILGDEGSGAHLGKLLVGDLLKNQLPASLKEQFLQQYQLTPARIIDSVYRRPFPNRFLAGFAPFLAQHVAEPEVHRLVVEAFKAFFQRNVLQYPDSRRLPIHATGSVAFHFQLQLAEAAAALGLRLDKVEQTPLPGLVRYFSR